MLSPKLSPSQTQVSDSPFFSISTEMAAVRARTGNHHQVAAAKSQTRVQRWSSYRPLFSNVCLTVLEWKVKPLQSVTPGQDAGFSMSSVCQSVPYSHYRVLRTTHLGWRCDCFGVYFVSPPVCNNKHVNVQSFTCSGVNGAHTHTHTHTLSLSVSL